MTNNQNTEQLYKCKLCGAIYQAIVTECDCAVGDPFDYEVLIAYKLLDPQAKEDTDTLDPDMPTQELRLHMGELTANEILVAKAAIRWANSRISK